MTMLAPAVVAATNVPCEHTASHDCNRLANQPDNVSTVNVLANDIQTCMLMYATLSPRPELLVAGVLLVLLLPGAWQ